MYKNPRYFFLKIFNFFFCKNFKNAACMNIKFSKEIMYNGTAMILVAFVLFSLVQYRIVTISLVIYYFCNFHLKQENENLNIISIFNF